MEKEKMYLLRKDEDMLYSLIIFKNRIDFRQLEDVIFDYTEKEGINDIDETIEHLKTIFDIEKVINFDYISKNTGDIDNKVTY